ncbi:MAG TPA: thiamine phosphate synthase [Longimicrobiales bacterium]|nr:thiamine phosphate synthase [Longimicrobiales bacterium]
MLPRLHLVTSDAVLARPDFAVQAAAVMAACGSDIALHLRGHGTTGATLHALGEELAGAALRTGAWLLVNDRIDVAMAVRANGVQLGVASLPVPGARLLLGHGARIGYSVHGPLESAQAAADGADFVLAGTIWDSASHPGRDPAGLPMLRECVAQTPVPVLAIGGVTPARVADAAGAGAWGVAVLGGVWHAEDCVAAAERYRDSVLQAYVSGKRQEQG